jgi:acetyl-CoA carboxylase carboxyl transferase subunit alpha
MLETSIYSVISPEACASIMWRDAGKRAQAAEALRATASDAKLLGCVDDIVPEPEGGAQIDPEGAAMRLKEKLTWHLNELQAKSVHALVTERYRKFRNIAQFYAE